MAIPTFTSITPDQGHSGGALVNITGTNFRLFDEPPPGLPVTGPATARVQVIFQRSGYEDEYATQVGVESTTSLYCIVPPLDPYTRTIAFTATDAGDLFTAVGHGLKGSEVIQLVGASLPAGVDSATPYYAVSITANTFQLALTEGGAPVSLTGDGSGDAKVDGAYDVKLVNIDDSDAPIATEEVTATIQYRPLRPNLSIRSHLDETLSSLLRSLKQQIVENVSWTTDSDYNEDEETAEIAMPARLPALVLSGLTVNETNRHGVTYEEDENIDDPDTGGNFISYRRPMIVDIGATLIGVADDSHDIIGLLQATKMYFRKNNTLRVRRDIEEISAGYINYNLRASRETAVSVREDNTNLQWFAMDIRVEAVRLEQIPGMPRKTIPGVSTTGRPHEAIVRRGYTLQVDVDDNYDGIDLTTSET